MKLNTVRKYNFSMVYSGYKEFQDPNTGATQITYETPVEIKCWVVNNALGELVLHTKSKLQNNSSFSYLLDKDGGLVYPIGTATGAIWRIIEGMPMYDLFGKVYEYKYRCLMIVPKQGAVTGASAQELGIDFSI